MEASSRDWVALYANVVARVNRLLESRPLVLVSTSAPVGSSGFNTEDDCASVEVATGKDMLLVVVSGDTVDVLD